MDESVKRRERLKAMRSEASSHDGGVSFHDLQNSASPPPLLCNPLLNSTPTQPIHGDSNSISTSRFDYYTDPLSAFSGAKRTKQDSPNSFVPPPRPSPPPYMPPPPLSHQSRPPYSPSFGMSQNNRPFFPPQQQYGIPPGMRSPYGPPHQGPTGTWNAPVHPPDYHGPMNSVRGNNSFSPHPAQGRGPWHNHIPFSGTSHKGNHQQPSNMGRGRGRYNNFVRPGGGRGGGWTGSRNQSAENAPGAYYDKSSVEDPWKSLMPVTWKGGKGLIVESSRALSMATESVAKKPETSSKWSAGPGPSLAEFLADSFNEAAADRKETSKD